MRFLKNIFFANRIIRNLEFSLDNIISAWGKEQELNKSLLLKITKLEYKLKHHNTKYKYIYLD